MRLAILLCLLFLVGCTLPSTLENKESSRSQVEHPALDTTPVDNFTSIVYSMDPHFKSVPDAK